MLAIRNSEEVITDFPKWAPVVNLIKNRTAGRRGTYTGTHKQIIDNKYVVTKNGLFWT